MKDSGIYKIVSLKSKKIYVGSSVSLKKRWRQHVRLLESNKHFNPHLQNAWNKYGADHFEFVVIERCEEKELIPREQYWLDHLQAFKREIGYNKSDVVGVRANSKRYIVTTPHGYEIDVFNLDKFCRQNNLSDTSMHRVANGDLNQHKGWTVRHFSESKSSWLLKRKRSRKSGSGWKGDWLIKKKDGSEVTVKSLTKFIKDNNYSRGNIYEFMSGKRKSCYDFLSIKKVLEKEVGH